MRSIEILKSRAAALLIYLPYDGRNNAPYETQRTKRGPGWPTPYTAPRPVGCASLKNDRLQPRADIVLLRRCCLSLQTTGTGS